MYAKVNGSELVQYPYSFKDLRNDNPNTSFPRSLSTEILTAFNAVEVQKADEPTYDKRTQTCQRAENPTLVDGTWTLGWVISDKTAAEITEYDEIAAGVARGKRDSLLAETDWWALSDTPSMTDAQSTYRQALRDITSHVNWPHLEDADWPTKPS